MKKAFWILGIAVLAIAGCKQLSKQSHSVKPPMAPLPPGFKLSTTERYAPARVNIKSVSYIPTDFALTAVRLQGPNVVLEWINGTAPFQPQYKANILDAWTNYGPATALRSITNPAVSASKGFFRIMGAGA